MNKLPTNWSEVSIKQFNELREIDDNTSDFMKQVLILSILLNIDPDDKEIEDMDVNDLIKHLSNLKFLSIPPSTEPKKYINDFKLIEINKISLGQFIDLDHFITENPLINLSKIAAILYNKFNYDNFDNIKLELYDDINLDDRSLYFESISIHDTFGLINYFLTFKNIIYTSYNNIFNPILNEEDLDEEDLEDPEVVKEIAKEKNQAKFAWEFILYNLSKGDITKYDEILNLPLIFILNQLTFKKNFSLD